MFFISCSFVVGFASPPHWKMRENATSGDRLTESVASKLQFLTPKDYSGLFSELSQAATAYEVAKDQDGMKVSGGSEACIHRCNRHVFCLAGFGK